MSDDEPKTAYELILERLKKKDRDEGVREQPLTDDQRARIGEVRKVYEAKLAFAGSWAARASSFAVASAIAARVVASISAGVFSNLGRVRIARLRAAAAWKAATSRKGVAAGSGAAPADAGPASADIRTGVVRTAITKPRILSHMGWFISLNCEEGDLLAYDEAGLRVRLERRGQARLLSGAKEGP